MKQLNVLKTFFVATLLIASNVMANQAPSDQDVRNYLELSGANLALSSIPQQIAMMGQQANLTNNNPEKNREATETILAAWDEHEVNQAVFSHVKNNISSADMNDLLAWLNTDFSQQMKAAEGQSADPSFQVDFMRYMAEIQTNPPSEARISQVNEFVDIAKSVDFTVELVVDIVKGIAKSEGSKSPEQVEAMIGQMKNIMKPQLDQQMKMVSYYVYRDVSEQDLAKYMDFYKKELGQKELSLMYSAIGEGVANWSARLGKLIKEQKAQKAQAGE